MLTKGGSLLFPHMLAPWEEAREVAEGGGGVSELCPAQWGSSGRGLSQRPLAHHGSEAALPNPSPFPGLLPAPTKCPDWRSASFLSSSVDVRALVSVCAWVGACCLAPCSRAASGT